MIKQMVKVLEIVRQRGNLTQLFTALKAVKDETIHPSHLDELKEYFRFKDAGLSRGVQLIHQPEILYTCRYRSYQDWFTRSLRPEVIRDFRRKVVNRPIVMPNECVIESIGNLSDMSSIIRLKKPSKAKADLKKLGVPATHNFVNMKLLTSHYHHVHAPVAGKVRQIKPIHEETPLFGRVSLNFVEIEAEIGSVYLLIVGEAVVQDFVAAVETGSEVEKLDDLGHFGWGSQTVILFPDHAGRVIPQAREYHFMGDPIV